MTFAGKKKRVQVLYQFPSETKQQVAVAVSDISRPQFREDGSRLVSGSDGSGTNHGTVVKSAHEVEVVIREAWHAV